MGQATRRWDRIPRVCASLAAPAACRCRDVLLIVYPRFKADETVDPLATAPQVVFANVTGWRGTIQEARQIPTRR